MNYLYMNCERATCLCCVVLKQAVLEGATICLRPLWPFDLESGVRVTCDVGYLRANLSLPRPLCSRLRPDVRDRRTDIRRASSLTAPAMGAGHNKAAEYCPHPLSTVDLVRVPLRRYVNATSCQLVFGSLDIRSLSPLKLDNFADQVPRAFYRCPDTM